MKKPETDLCRLTDVLVEKKRSFPSGKFHWLISSRLATATPLIQPLHFVLGMPNPTVSMSDVYREEPRFRDHIFSPPASAIRGSSKPSLPIFKSR
jgi:hypothetical protein